MKCTYSKNHKMEQEEKILVVLLLVVMKCSNSCDEDIALSRTQD